MAVKANALDDPRPEEDVVDGFKVLAYLPSRTVLKRLEELHLMRGKRTGGAKSSKRSIIQKPLKRKRTRLDRSDFDEYEDDEDEDGDGVSEKDLKRVRDIAKELPHASTGRGKIKNCFRHVYLANFIYLVLHQKEHGLLNPICFSKQEEEAVTGPVVAMKSVQSSPGSGRDDRSNAATQSLVHNSSEHLVLATAAPGGHVAQVPPVMGFGGQPQGQDAASSRYGALPLSANVAYHGANPPMFNQHNLAFPGGGNALPLVGASGNALPIASAGPSMQQGAPLANGVPTRQ
eukprot:CAMPEP_0113915480 /NCGR_PEP_ID=MMETSP0780_2-20120614/31276_1 /TAXON_ID=652834 /ORGANISM="Palpitomonas bilix" /LENGTH=288 /DNA_ID=CAMNT_0000914095 /DNA_START=117 /DNA_END=983 /DNA_ORIENTATION=+ /assembly_acc=CAM_ASM_000599